MSSHRLVPENADSEPLDLATDQIHEVVVPDTWIEVQLMTGTGRPCSDEFVVVHPPHRDSIDAHLDDEGVARIEPIPRGYVVVEFPSLFSVQAAPAPDPAAPSSGRSATVRHPDDGAEPSEATEDRGSSAPSTAGQEDRDELPPGTGRAASK